MGFKVEMQMTLTLLGFIFLNFVRRGKILYFLVRQGKSPRDMLENLAGSHDCCTGDIGCRFFFSNENREIFYFPIYIIFFS